MIRVVNIKEDNPNSDYAMYLLDQEIKYSKAVGNKVIIVIHGYGSHGCGGVIKQKLKSYLPELKKNKVIEDFVFGENWGELNPVKQKICKVCPEAILNENLSSIKELDGVETIQSIETMKNGMQSMLGTMKSMVILLIVASAIL